MTLEIDGFLSDRAPVAATHVAPELAPLSTLAHKLNQFAVSVVTAPRTAPKTLGELLPFALVGRLVQDFEAAVLLADRGFRAQSRSMARSTLESAFYCIAACREAVLTKGVKDGGPVAFLEAFIAGHEQFRRRIAKELAGLPETANEQRIRLNQLHQELSNADLGSGIDVRGLAEDLGLSDMYTVLYRPLSQDSHPSPTSVEHHISSNEAGAISGFQIGPDYKQYGETILAAVAGLLLGLDGYIVRFGDAREQRIHAEIVSEYKSMTEASAA